MSDTQLNTCPICGCWSRFEYGGAMDSGKRIVKVRCDIGCVEQVIFYCEESDAAKAWNFRQPTSGFRDMLEALRMAEKKLIELEHAVGGGDDEIGVEVEILTIRAAIAKAEGKS